MEVDLLFVLCFRYREGSSEEDEDSYVPTPSKSRGGSPGKTPTKAARKATPASRKRPVVADVSDEEAEKEEGVTPTKGHGRSSPAKRGRLSTPKKTDTDSSPQKSVVNYQETSDGEEEKEEEDSEVVNATPSKSKGGGATKTKAAAKKAVAKAKAAKKAPSRGGRKR